MARRGRGGAAKAASHVQADLATPRRRARRRSSDRTVRIWDLERRDQLTQLLAGHHSLVLAVGVGTLNGSPIAVSGSDDRTLRIWDLASGRQIGDALSGHTGSVDALTIAEVDGRTIAVSGGQDRTVRVWDIQRGEEVGEPITGHTGAVRAVALGHLDGRRVVISGGDDQVLRLADMRTGEQCRTIDIGAGIHAIAPVVNGAIVGATAGVLRVILSPRSSAASS